MSELQKIFIAEVAEQTPNDRYFPYYQDCWGIRPDNDYTGFVDPSFNFDNQGIETINNVISFTVNQKQYTKVTNLSTVISTPGTYRFVDGLLLVHFDDNKTPYHFSSVIMKIGIAIGYYNSPSGRDSNVFNGVGYSPRLLNNQLIKSEKDDIFYGKQRFPSLSVKIDNHDFGLAYFNVSPTGARKHGSFTRLLFWEGEDSNSAVYSEFQLLYQGVIEDIQEGNEITLSLQDLRKTLTEKTPANILDNSNFPNIKDGTYRKPQVWGNCSEIPCICLNEEVNKDVKVLPPDSETASNYQFMICDISQRSIASDSITALFINNEVLDITAPTVQYDLVNNIAYFELSETYFRKTETDDSGTVTGVSWGNQSKVSIDCAGYIGKPDPDDGTYTDTDLITNGLAVIRAIVYDVYRKPFNTDFYNVSTWNTFESTAYDIAYYLEKPVTVQKQIQEIQNSQLGRFTIDENILYSFDNDDFDSYFSKDIASYMFMPERFRPAIKADPKEVLSRFRVGYKKRWAVNSDELSFRWQEDTSNVNNAIERYNSTKEHDFTTLLTDLTDVSDYSSRILEYEAGNSKDTFTCEVPWDFKDLKAGDWIRVEIDLPNSVYLGDTRCQVQSVRPNVNSWTVNLTLRIFTYLTTLVDENDIPLVDENGVDLIGG